MRVPKRLRLNPSLRLVPLLDDRLDLADPAPQSLIVRPELQQRVQRVVRTREIAALEQLERLMLELGRIHRHAHAGLRSTDAQYKRFEVVAAVAVRVGSTRNHIEDRVIPLRQTESL